MHATATAERAAGLPFRFRAPWQGAAASMAILRREFLVTLRGWRLMLVVFLMSLLAVYFLLRFWPPPETDLRNIGAAPKFILISLSLVLLGAMYLVLPGFAAASILGERQQQTYELLKLSLIPPIWMAVAKLVSCVGFFFLCFCAVLPVFAANFFLVGIDAQQFVGVMALLTAHAFTCSAAGLAVSARVRRPVVAIALSYTAAILLSGVPFILAYELTVGPLNVQAAVISPFASITTMVDGEVSFAEFLPSIPIQLGWFVLFFGFVVVSVRRPERPPRENQEKIVDDPAVLEARRKTFPFYLVDPLRRRPEIPDDQNPMRIKELRWGMLGREARMIRLCYVTATVMFFVSLFLANRAPTWVVLQFGLLVMLAPAFIASAVSKEYELGNMDLMRLTLLDGRALLHGKLWAGALSLTPVLIGLFLGGIPMVIAHLFLFGGVDFAAPRIVVWFYPLLVTFTAFVLGVGLLSSVVWRKTAAATVCSYLVVSATLFVSPAIMAVRDMAVSLDQSETARNAFAFLSPIGLTLRYPRQRGHEFILSDAGQLALQCCVMLCIALVAVRATEILFVRRRMQDR